MRVRQPPALTTSAEVILRTSTPLHFDAYTDIPGTGSFVLADPGTHATVAGGMLQGVSADPLGADEGTTMTGRAIWLETTDSEAEALAADLRRLGKKVVLLKASSPFRFGAPISMP